MFLLLDSPIRIEFAMRHTFHLEFIWVVCILSLCQSRSGRRSRRYDCADLP